MKKIIVLASVMVAFATIALSAQSVRELYEKLHPSVAVIHVEDAVRRDGRLVGYQSALGSGVLVSEDGYMLTAAHVVQTAENIMIEFYDGQKAPAKVIRLVKNADIALLKLNWLPGEYPIAQLGDSDTIGIGDQVLVIGAPYGLAHSLSVGYISGRHVEANKTNGFVSTEFLQTDAAINQGNSGGPMFNRKGEIVGIVSHIMTESGGFDGLGFAATSNLARSLLLDKETPWTGIDGFFLDEALAALLNVPQKGGLLVQSVVGLSLADLAGIRGGDTRVVLHGVEMTLGGDIILAVGNVELTSRNELEEWVRITTLADLPESIPVKILRGGEIKMVDFSLD